MRNYDWTHNQLGPLDNWPEALKISVSLILTSQQPMVIWWGEHLINLYNDGYANFLYTKYPHALGKPAADSWPEIWDDIILQRIQFIKSHQRGTFDEAMPVVNMRRGYPEITYATFSYSPILNEAQLDGILCLISEVPDQLMKSYI